MVRLINKIPTAFYVTWVVVVGGATAALWMNPMNRPQSKPELQLSPCACHPEEPDAVTTGRPS